MGRLCLHSGSQGSYYFFRDNIREHLRLGQENSFLYLLPVNRAVRYFKKQLVLDSQEKALQDPGIFTFRSFFQFLYQKYPERKKVISQPMRQILLSQVLREQHDRLSYFQPDWNFGRGLLVKIDQMLDEFFQFGFQAEDFSSPPLSAEKKYNDFGFLIHAVTERYNRALTDESSLISLVLSQLSGNVFRTLFPDLKNIYISGFGIYSPPMLQFIRLAKEYTDIDVKIEYEPRNAVLFHHTLNAYDALSPMADKTQYHKKDRTGAAVFLFNPAANTTKGTGLQVPVRIRKMTTRTDELRRIARDIKQLSAERHLPLKKIGLTFPELDKYVPLIRKIFTEFGIPFNLSTGIPLSHSPLIQIYRQVLEIVNSGFRVGQVYLLALSPYLKNDLSREAHLIYQSALKCGLQFFNDGWEKRIEKLASSDVKEILGPVSAAHLPPEDLGAAINAIKSLCENIKPLQGSRSASDFQATYLAVLKSLGLMDWYSRENEILTISEKEHEFRAFNKFIQLFDQTIWMLKYLNHDQLIDLQTFYQQLIMVIESATYNLREWSDYGVQIMPRLEILSLDIDYLFVGGMVEGEFPRLFTRDIFFNDQERQEMGLNASEDRLSQDRFLFFQWLSFPLKQLVFSYPQVDGDKPLLPSTFFAALQEIDPDIVTESSAGEEKLYSKESFLENLTYLLRDKLSDEDKKAFQYWRLGEPHDKIRRWETGIRLLNEKRRYSKITAYEGNLTRSTRVKSWLHNIHTRRAFSVTALESYAFCPMQYFLQRILKLEEPEEPEHEITALEKGNLIHKILYTFYRDLTASQRKTPWLYEKKLFQIADSVFSSMPYDDIQWRMEKEKYFGPTGQAGLFNKFLQNERESIQESGFIPAYFELRFGSRQNRDYFQINGPSGLVSLYGIIDRIDVHPAGQFIVIDYKTGTEFKNVNLIQIFKGNSLQLPVYLAAAGQYFKKQGQMMKPVGGLYFQVRDTENCKRLIIFADSDEAPFLTVDKKAALPKLLPGQQEEKITFLQLITQSLSYAAEYVNQIDTGNFRHTRHPMDDRCKSHCSFSRICRKDPLKLMTIV